VCGAIENTGSRLEKERQSLGNERNGCKRNADRNANDDGRGAEDKPRTTIWLSLTGPIAFLVAIAAGVGFYIEDLYRDTSLNAAVSPLEDSTIQDGPRPVS
jgi:hypothetical protein